MLKGDQVADAGMRASRLLARATAAKEATGKSMAKVPSCEHEAGRGETARDGAG